MKSDKDTTIRQVKYAKRDIASALRLSATFGPTDSLVKMELLNAQAWIARAIADIDARNARKA